MTAARPWLWLVGAALAGITLFRMVGGHSEESELSARLARASEAIRGERGELGPARRARLERVAAELCAPDLVVTMPELPLDEPGSGALFTAVAEALAPYGRTGLSLGRVSSRVDRARQAATSDVEATFHGETARGLFLDRRNAVVSWSKASGQWRMVRILIGDRDRAQPEARP